MARAARVKSERTKRLAFDNNDFKDLAKEWYWGGTKNIPVGNLGDKRYIAAYKQAYDEFVDALKGGRVEKEYLDRIPETFLKKMGLTKATIPPGKKPPKAEQPPKVKPDEQKKPPATPENKPKEERALPDQGGATEAPKESRFSGLASGIKKVGVGVMSSMLGSNPLTAPYGKVLEGLLDDGKADSDGNKKNRQNKAPSNSSESEHTPTEKVQDVAPADSGVSSEKLIPILEKIDEQTTKTADQAEKLNKSSKDINDELKESKEHAKVIAQTSKSILEQLSEKASEVKERVSGEKLTPEEKRARSAKFMQQKKELDSAPTGIKDGALTETPAVKHTNLLSKVKSGAAKILTTGKESLAKAPSASSVMKTVAKTIGAGAETIKSGATVAKDKISSLFSKPKEENDQESKVESAVKGGEDVAILKEISANTKATVDALGKLATATAATKDKESSDTKSAETTASPSPVGSALELAGDVAGNLPSGGGKAAEKGAAKAGEKAAGKGAAKAGAKAAGKGIGKALLKKIPIIGAVAGLGFAASRAMSGDWTGAGMEAASGLAGTIPGVGTAASVGIDAALAAKDAGVFDKTSEVEGVAKNGPIPEEIEAGAAKKQEIESAEKQKAAAGNGTTIINNNNSGGGSGETKITSRSYPRNQDTTWQRIMQGRYV